jgi:flagellar biosynthesis/type III secretory pathway M-ring protein FliF/YscJ
VRSEVIKEGLEIVDMSVGVLINTAGLRGGLTDVQRDQVADWVMAATGITNPSLVSVHGFQFHSVEIEPDMWAELRNVIILTGVALLALIIMFIIIFMHIRKKQQERLALAAAMEQEEEEEAARSLVDMMSEEIEFEPIQLVDTQEQKLKAQIRDLAITDPEIVAQLIKTWLVNA